MTCPRPEHDHANCEAMSAFRNSIADLALNYLLHGHDPADSAVAITLATMQAVENNPEWWHLLRTRLVEPGMVDAVRIAADHVIHATVLKPL